MRVIRHALFLLRSSPYPERLTPLTTASSTMPPKIRTLSNTGGAPPSTSGMLPLAPSPPGRSSPPLLPAVFELPDVFAAVALSFEPGFFFAAVAAAPFSEPADRALSGTASPPATAVTGFHSCTAGAAAAGAMSPSSACVGGDAAAASSTAGVEDDGNTFGSPVSPFCRWSSPSCSVSTPVTEIAVCKHRCSERPMPPVTSKDDQFRPTASSKKMQQDPQLFPPPMNTTVSPPLTGVAEWYAAGGGLLLGVAHKVRRTGGDKICKKQK